MKKYFITGIVFLLPLTLTFIIVSFLVNLLTEPFVGVVSSILGYYGPASDGLFFFHNAQVQIFISKLLILTLLFFLTVFLGMITHFVFMHYIIRFWDYLLNRIPLVRTIYKTSKDVINTIFKTDAGSFKQVVMVPFPGPNSKGIGFVTREATTNTGDNHGDNKVVVFVPTTPNPTSGFLMLFDPSEITYLDLSVEDAFKYIISCGVISTPLNPIVQK